LNWKELACSQDKIMGGRSGAGGTHKSYLEGQPPLDERKESESLTNIFFAQLSKHFCFSLSSCMGGEEGWKKDEEVKAAHEEVKAANGPSPSEAGADGVKKEDGDAEECISCTYVLLALWVSSCCRRSGSTLLQKPKAKQRRSGDGRRKATDLSSGRAINSTCLSAGRESAR